MDQSFAIPNRHSQFVPPQLWTAAGEFLSIFENAHGEQLIVNVSRVTRSGHFSSGDTEWEIDPISEKEIMPNFIFEPAELTWYISCWMAILGRSYAEVADLCRPK